MTYISKINFQYNTIGKLRRMHITIDLQKKDRCFLKFRYFYISNYSAIQYIFNDIHKRTSSENFSIKINIAKLLTC